MRTLSCTGTALAYTGVGSRRTPAPVQTLMRELARELARAGWVLRSGAAEGADSAFAAGCDAEPGALAEIYLPWRGFNGSDSARFDVCERALALARSVHPAWERLSPPAMRLHARNCYQVLGAALDAPSRFLVCWTPDGCESAAGRSVRTGGTATALALAERAGVPRFNLARAGRGADLREWLLETGVNARALPWHLARPDNAMALF